MINLNSLSLKELRKVVSEANVLIEQLAAEEALERTLNRLVPVKINKSELSLTEVKRFGGGFYREKYTTGGQSKVLFAKTKTGILYKLTRTAWENNPTWKKVG